MEKQIKWMTDIVGFNIIDVEFNNINGGSFCVSVAKNKFINENSILINKILKLEEDRIQWVTETIKMRFFEDKSLFM